MSLPPAAVDPIPAPLADELFLDLARWRAPNTVRHDQGPQHRGGVIAAQSSQEAP
ncbi:hypothetical protein [Streptomyces filamentosus]|uniref:hypothetical protein n=1 Tax=Streptomyces filamentosus TaxID=67294 RepID=UPI0033FC5BD4